MSDLAEGSEERPHLVGGVLGPVVQLAEDVQHDDHRAERLDHPEQPADAFGVVESQPIGGRAVKRQDVERGVTLGSDAGGHPLSHVADVLLGRAVDRRTFADRPAEERLAERDGRLHVDREQALPRLLPSRQEGERAKGKDAGDGPLRVRQVQGEQLVQGEGSERAGIAHRATAFPPTISTKPPRLAPARMVGSGA